MPSARSFSNQPADGAVSQLPVNMRSRTPGNEIMDGFGAAIVHGILRRGFADDVVLMGTTDRATLRLPRARPRFAAQRVSR